MLSVSQTHNCRGKINMELDWENLAGTLLSGSIAVGVAKYFLGNAMARFEALPDKLADINSKLSAIAVKLESVDKMQATIYEHDRKIFAIELRGSRVSTRRPDQVG